VASHDSSYSLLVTLIGAAILILGVAMTFDNYQTEIFYFYLAISLFGYLIMITPELYWRIERSGNQRIRGKRLIIIGYVTLIVMIIYLLIMFAQNEIILYQIIYSNGPALLISFLGMGCSFIGITLREKEDL